MTEAYQQTPRNSIDESVRRPRRIKLFIVSHHFPSIAKPTHAVYNKQNFFALSSLLDIKILVPVDWVSVLINGRNALRGDSPLDVTYVPYFYVPKLFRRYTPIFMRWSIGRCFRKIMKWEPDAVLASWVFPDAVAVRELLDKSSAAFFAQVHGSDVYLHCSVPERRKQVVAALNSAKTTFAVSGALRQSLIDFGVAEDRVDVVYNGVNDEKFFPVDRRKVRRMLNIDDEREVFLFVGNLKIPKGPIDLLEAFFELAERGRLTNTTLVYVGKGPDRNLLERRARQLEGICDGIRVRIVGSVPHEAINHWMNAADYVCLPSHSEGVPNAILESMRVGIPIIASNVGGIPEVLPAECGVMVPAKDVVAIADGLEKARATKWNRDKIREYSQRFRWGTNARIIQSLIGGDA